MFSCFTAMRHDIAKAELWAPPSGFFREVSAGFAGEDHHVGHAAEADGVEHVAGGY